MSLSAREIADVVAELQPLAGAFVQKVYLPEPRTLVLEVRQPGASHLLLVSAEQGRTRLHRAEERPPSPEPPLPWQAVARGELTGRAIDAIEVLAGERAVRLTFRNPEGRLILVAELTGRHGNLFLLDESGRIRSAAVPNLSQQRDNRPGNPYVPPFARATPPPGDETTRFEKAGEAFGLSAAVERTYRERVRTQLAAERRQAQLQTLRSRRQQLLRTLGKVEGDLARAMAADEHRRLGELLKANLHRVARGQREVELTDYTEEGPRQVVVRLDPALGPRENLERAFHRYRRLFAGQVRARARRDELQAALAQLEARLAEVESLDEEALLRASSPGSPAPSPLLPPARKRQGPARPFREYLLPSGQRVRVGRGAQQNDALTFRWSKGNDAWFHARGVAGAHVVVPLDRNETLKDETMRDAALLAAHNSEAKGESAVEVAWTRVKYVRKIKGAPGAVTYSQERSVLVRRDPERMARIKETEDGAAAPRP